MESFRVVTWHPVLKSFAGAGGDKSPLNSFINYLFPQPNTYFNKLPLDILTIINLYMFDHVIEEDIAGHDKFEVTILKEEDKYKRIEDNVVDGLYQEWYYSPKDNAMYLAVKVVMINRLFVSAYYFGKHFSPQELSIANKLLGQGPSICTFRQITKMALDVYINYPDL